MLHTPSNSMIGRLSVAKKFVVLVPGPADSATRELVEAILVLSKAVLLLVEALLILGEGFLTP